MTIKLLWAPFARRHLLYFWSAAFAAQFSFGFASKRSTQEGLLSISGWSEKMRLQALSLESSKRLVEVGRYKEALDLAEKIRRDSLTPELKYTHFMLLTEVLEKLEDWPGVVAVFEKWEHLVPKDAQMQTRSFRYFLAAINAGLFQSAKNRVLKDFALYDEDFLPDTIYRALIQLAQKIPEIDKLDAFTMPRSILHNFPATAVSREAFKFWDDTFCNQRVLANENFLGSKGFKREHALRLFRRFGDSILTKSYVFDLLNWQENTPELAFTTRDKLTQNQLMQLAEDLQTMKQHKEVLLLLDKLKLNAHLADSIPLDKILFLRARSLSGTQRAKEASDQYEVIFRDFPNSNFALQARERRILSLHSQKKYGQVAEELLGSEKRLLKDQKNVWRGFWAAYLDKNQNKMSAFRKMWKQNPVHIDSWLNQASMPKVPINTTLELSAKLDVKSKGVSKVIAIVKERAESQQTTDYWEDRKLQLGEPVFAAGLIAIGALAEATYFLEKTFKTQGDRRTSAAFLELLSRNGSAGTASRLARQSFKELEKSFRSEAEFVISARQFKELWQLNYPLAYISEVLAACTEFGVDPLTIWSLMRTESNYNPKAISQVGARGLIQIMPTTAEKIAQNLKLSSFSIQDLMNPLHNIRFATWYFKFLKDYFLGNEALAIAAYNAGPEAVVRWLKQTPELRVDEFLENIPFTETHQYVKKVMTAQKMYSLIYNIKFETTDPRAFLPQELPRVRVF